MRSALPFWSFDISSIGRVGALPEQGVGLLGLLPRGITLIRIGVRALTVVVAVC